jgi:hypothetical protein
LRRRALSSLLSCGMDGPFGFSFAFFCSKQYRRDCFGLRPIRCFSTICNRTSDAHKRQDRLQYNDGKSARAEPPGRPMACLRNRRKNAKQFNHISISFKIEWNRILEITTKNRWRNFVIIVAHAAHKRTHAQKLKTVQKRSQSSSTTFTKSYLP